MQNKATRLELFKILDKKYANDFLTGKLYMNPLQYFRNLENPAQGDPLEGACGTIKKNQLKQVGIHFSNDFLQAISDNVTLLSNFYAANNLFCMYCLQINDEKKTVQRPNEELRSFTDQATRQKVVVHIKDKTAFLRKLDSALQKALKEHTIEYSIYGKVEYQSTWLNADGPGSRSAFHKEPPYAYQSEWRLCVLRYTQDQNAFTLSIGDLHNIAEEISLEDLLSYPEVHYPNYRAIDDTATEKCETYRILSSGNAVNHLMYSYMPQTNDEPALSDQAKADWHYAQFLNLSDRQDEIDTYLMSCLKKYKDLEHVKLIVDYRLSRGEWVKATDPFVYALKNFPEEVQNSPGKFFFPLHTILMEHGKVTDAGRLLEIAKKDHKLSGELAQIMESDCLLALGFFDKAVTIFKAMQRTSNDPILYYDLAVCYFYLLSFEESQAYLDQYKAYYSSSPKSIQNTQRLQKLLDCFNHHNLFAQNPTNHSLSNVTWDAEIEHILAKAKTKVLCLGIDALWKIETAQKWNMLHDIKTIKICTMTIFHIIELYQQTGDPTFYHIIEQLRLQKNIAIVSPKMNYYLIVDLKRKELLPHCKMEQALYAQNQQNEEA